MNRLTAYYAHCIAIYDSEQESRDLALIWQLGFDPVNPNNDTCAEGYRRHGMEYFTRFAGECDVCVFRALPDGTIPAGVAHEIAMFRQRAKPVIELPSAIARRTLSVHETREYLRECGNR